MRSSARPRLRRPATAGGVRPRWALISASDSPWQCRSTRAWRLASGNRASASTRRRIASFRSASSDGEDCSAASHPSRRADEFSIAASSDCSRAHPAWHAPEGAPRRPGCMPVADEARPPSRLRIGPGTELCHGGRRARSVARCPTDRSWPDRRGQAEAQPASANRCGIGPASAAAGIGRLGHNKPPGNLAVIGAAMGRAAIALSSTARSKCVS